MSWSSGGGPKDLTSLSEVNRVEHHGDSHHATSATTPADMVEAGIAD
jgi:hypothetical protein